MPPIRFSPLPRLNLYLKPLFLFSTSSLSPKKFTIPKRTLLASSRTLSTLASAQPASDNGASDGRSSALSPPQKEELQKIDVNPPKGTRYFPPEDMRLCNWLFTHFREVSGLFGFEEVDYRVLESEHSILGKQGRRSETRLKLSLFLLSSLFSRELESLQLMLALRFLAERVTKQIEKIPVDEMKKELNSTGLSEHAIEELLQVLSIKSLTKLEEKLEGGGEAISELKQLFSLAEEFGYSEWIQFDASVVRGLAYYTGF